MIKRRFKKQLRTFPSLLADPLQSSQFFSIHVWVVPNASDTFLTGITDLVFMIIMSQCRPGFQLKY